MAGSIPQYFPKVTDHDSNSNLLQMNQPMMTKMITITQYGFIILAFSGLVLLGYGAIAKKKNLSTAKES